MLCKQYFGLPRRSIYKNFRNSPIEFIQIRLIGYGISTSSSSIIIVNFSGRLGILFLHNTIPLILDSGELKLSSSLPKKGMKSAFGLIEQYLSKKT